MSRASNLVDDLNELACVDKAWVTDHGKNEVLARSNRSGMAGFDKIVTVAHDHGFVPLGMSSDRGEDASRFVPRQSHRAPRV